MLEENYMSLAFDPTTLLYAVIEYLKSSEHIYDPVDTKPEQDGQYRLICLAVNSDDAWRAAHILRALSDSRYWYSVCVAEPEEAEGELLPIVETGVTNHTT